MAYMEPFSSGRYAHCGLCGGPLISFLDNKIDYMEYCRVCRFIPALDKDDVIDATDVLAEFTLMASLMKFLKVREMYFHD